METIKNTTRPSMLLSVDPSAVVAPADPRLLVSHGLRWSFGGDVIRAPKSAAAANVAVPVITDGHGAVSVDEPIYAATTLRTQGLSVGSDQPIDESVGAGSIGVDMPKQGTGVFRLALAARQGYARGVPPRGPDC